MLVPDQRCPVLFRACTRLSPTRIELPLSLFDSGVGTVRFRAISGVQAWSDFAPSTVAGV